MEEIVKTDIYHVLIDKKNEYGKWRKYLKTLWGDVRFRSPKLIVCLSVTKDDVFTFKKGTAVFPAVLDTGFSGDFEISEEHFNHRDIQSNDVYHSLHTLNRSSDNRDYDEIPAHIWLHRFGYDYHNIPQDPAPVHLGKTKRLHLIKSAGKSNWPVLPLLGLDALLTNNLEVRIDSTMSQFRIIKY